MARRRTWLVRAFLVVGGILAGLGLLAGHVNRHILDGPTFADHVDDLRRDDAVAAQVGASISTKIIRARPDLLALRPLIEAVSVRVAGGDVLSGPVRRTARAAHTALTEPGADSVVLRIADAGAVVAGVLGAVAPERAPVASEVSVTLASIGDQSFAGTTIAVTRSIGLLAWLLPLVAAAFLVGAVVLSPDRWRAAVHVGWVLVWVAAWIGLVLVVGGFLVRRLDTDTLGGAVGQAGWREFVRPLWWSALALGVFGTVVMLTCGSATPARLRETGLRVGAALRRRPATSLGIVGRAAAAGAVGVAAVADPGGMVELAMLVVGVGLVMFAVTEVAGLAQVARSRRVATAGPSGSGHRSGPRRTAIVAAGVATALAVGGVVLLARPGRDVDVGATSDPNTQRCNGHAELCDRTFDDVAYVAAHNAMSVARQPGWFLPEQLDPIPVQLDQGVRALLIDVWSGRPAGTVVRTAPGSYDEALTVTRDELGPDVVAAAGRIASAVAGDAVGPEARFMCHGLCETGSTPFLETLVELRGWLTTHPDEVVTLFIEDRVDSELIAADVEAAGLLPYVHAPGAGEPWPTLGEMIGSGQRLVVMVEAGVGGDAAPWLVNGFEFTQDTPFTFPTLDSFSCEPNRGLDDAPLLLLNHWLAGFSSLVTDARAVNARDVLLTRAERCEDERGQIPNFVAVNFVTIGDVFSVVDELNGVT